MKKSDIFLLLATFFISIIIILYGNHYVSAEDSSNDTMIVEVNLVGFGNGTTNPGISIEVPDHIFIGNVTKNSLLSNEVSVRINNTGSVPVIVTPDLEYKDNELMSYLFFRTQKTTTTNNTRLVTFYRVGNYSIDIDKPASGSRVRYKSIYMQLNLTDYPESIDSDIVGYKTNIIFYAVPQ